MSESKVVRAVIAPPFTREEACDFLVALVRERNPPVEGNVSRADIERLIELSWIEIARRRILSEVVLKLATEGPVMFFRTSEEFGLVRHSEADRIVHAAQSRTKALSKIVRARKILEATDLSQLTGVQQLERERENMRLIALERKIREIGAVRWLSSQAPQLLE